MALRSRLKELTERNSDLNQGKARDPKIRSVDPVLMMMAGLAESAFGNALVDDIAADLNLSYSEMPTRPVLEMVTTRFFKEYLLPVMREKRHGSRVADRLEKLPALDDASYVDYFVLFTTMFDGERGSDPSFYRATTGIQGLLVGYQTLQAYQVCDGIVTFFKELRDQLGMETFIRSIALQIKRYEGT